MGFNTTVVVMNDALHAIEQDVQFGPRLVRAILEMVGRGNENIDVSAMGHCNAATVVATHHADELHAVVVGANTGLDLGYASSWQAYHDKSEPLPLTIVRNLASKLGYRLVKMSKPKKPVAMTPLKGATGDE